MGFFSPSIRYASTSSTATGWVAVVSHRGQSITDSRSVSNFSSRYDMLPAPITIPARNSTVSTPDARRISPTR